MQYMDANLASICFLQILLIYLHRIKYSVMSMYVGEIIEIKVGDRWKVLKTYYDASYCMTDASGEYPEDVMVHKSDEGDIIEHEWSLIDNGFYQTMLIDSGYFDNHREMPDDVSEEAKTIYEKLPNTPSIPSYYTLDEFNRHVHERLSSIISTIENSIENETKNLLNEKVDWIIEKLENPKLKPIMFNKLNKCSFWERIVEDRIEELIELQEIYGRIRTTVRNSYPNYIKDSEIRIIWFIY